MGTAVIELLQVVGLEQAGSVPWGQRIPTGSPGVYMVSLHADPRADGGLREAPIDQAALQRWVTGLDAPTLHGKPVDALSLASHVSRWWLPGEPVLYIGKATALRSRVQQYATTPLGATKPHAGGYWLKMLAVLPSVHVHWAVTASADDAGHREDEMLAAFLDRARPSLDYPKPRLPLPWANLTIDRPTPRRRRGHGIRLA